MFSIVDSTTFFLFNKLHIKVICEIFVNSNVLLQSRFSVVSMSSFLNNQTDKYMSGQ